MNLYEVIFIGRQDLSQQQVDALGISLGITITQSGSEVVRSEYCGFRNLAYPINKNQKGHYYIIQMKANKSTVAELERTMKFNEDIIRHLIVKVDAFENKENLISQAKTFNDNFAAAGGSVVGAKGAGYRARHDAGSRDDDSIDKAEVVETIDEEIEVAE